MKGGDFTWKYTSNSPEKIRNFVRLCTFYLSLLVEHAIGMICLQVVRLTINYYDVRDREDRPCSLSGTYILVSDGRGGAAQLARLCGYYGGQQRTYTSSGSEMTVRFNSISSSYGFGFDASFVAVSRVGITTTTTTTGEQIDTVKNGNLRHFVFINVHIYVVILN